MKIGELAKSANCDVETVRYYERESLLPSPARTSANYRTYGPRHLERLQFIRRCRSLDMPLEEVRVLLSFRDSPERDCEAVNEVLDAHLKHVSVRLQELAVLELQLKRLRRHCRQVQASKHCGILKALGTDADGRARGSHVRGANSSRAKSRP